MQESLKADRYQTEKKYYVLSHPKQEGAYEMEIHFESLGGTLIRKTKALGRLRAAGLLMCLEDNMGATSVTEV